MHPRTFRNQAGSAGSISVIAGALVLGAATPLLAEDTVALPATIRDFKAYDESGGHNDFQRYSGTTRVGLVQELLDEDGKPALKSQSGVEIRTEFRDAQGRNINPALYNPSLGDVAGVLEPRSDHRIYSPASFHSWYRDVPGVNLSRVIHLTLRRAPGSDVYIFDSDTAPEFVGLGGFFPINGDLFGNYASWGKNFHFTTEVQTEFTYRRNAGYVFTFSGDDDVWVYINGRLVIDLGSLHSRKEQTIDLDRLDWLEDGRVYPLAIFHAERRTSASNFRMETTLPLRPAGLPQVTAAFD
ncbi:MAG: fibro-slime domain-containing protein [Phycisphaeraceae bacterium]|nr:fibro-slime domain-containing protein [Phycisphaeraceae bacterium]